MNKKFTNPNEAKAYGLSLQAQGRTVAVRIIPAQPDEVQLLPDSGAILERIALVSGNGDRMSADALAWAQRSTYWDAKAVPYSIACLDADTEDGVTNGAASLKQARLFLSVLEAHAGKVAKVSTVTKPGTPKTWEIVDTTPIQSPDTDGDWGTSVGNNGWMCDD